MQPILRKDGEWAVFRVEVFLQDHWSDAGGNDHFIGNVPLSIRCRKNGVWYENKQPFSDFSASGECWQQVGLHATFDESKAYRLAEILSKYNDGYRFRVVEHTCSQKRNELASFHRTVS